MSTDAQALPRSGSDLVLTVLGTSTPYPQPDNPCSGYLLEFDGVTLWIDAGPGTLAELQRYVGLDELTALWVSHVHDDHFGDLAALYYAYAFGEVGRASRLPVLGPPGWTTLVSDFVADDVVHDMNSVFEVAEHHDGDHHRFGELELLTRAVRHSVPAFGLRASVGERVLAYSGDSGPCDELVELALGATVFICEVGISSRSEGPWVAHSTPEDAGAMARRAEVNLLLLSHFGPSVDPQDAARRANREFDGPVRLAAPGLKVDVA